MRAVLASIVALAALLGRPAPMSASPPDDIAAYCRTMHPDQVTLQTRCVDLENAAAARVGRQGAGIDADAWNRCQASVASWLDMERCLAESARATGAGPGAAGAAGNLSERPPAPVTAPGPRPPADGGTPAPPAPAAAPAPAPPPGPPPSSTVILGPQPTPVPASERDRQTRPISEEDADRHLRSVLERNPSARCTKKQYGPGWVITCE